MLARLDEVVERDVDCLTHSAWLLGGAVAARAALEASEAVPGAVLRKAWAKGDEDKAFALVEVFTLPMVSRWYWIADRQIQAPPQQKELARRAAVCNILTVFGHYREELVDDFMGMDVQFNYECDLMEDKEGRAIHMEALLVLSNALGACGYPLGLDWTKLRFPVADVGELAEQLEGVPDSLTTPEPMAITMALTEGMRGMHEYFKYYNTG